MISEISSIIVPCITLILTMQFSRLSLKNNRKMVTPAIRSSQTINFIGLRDQMFQAYIMIFKSLDLHGKQHDEVEILVTNFITLNDLPVHIIVGNSKRMQDLVGAIIHHHGLFYHYQRWTNPGCFVVMKSQH